MTRKTARVWIDTLFVTATLSLFAYLITSFSKPEGLPDWLLPFLQLKYGPAILSVVLSVAMYKAIFGILSWGYRCLENRVFFHSTNILGKWCYELDVANKTPRIGRCTIFLHNGTLRMSGVHYHPGDEMFTANLDTQLIRVTYPEIFIRYVAVGIREGEVDRDEGIFELRADPSEAFHYPQKITGVWTDIFPNSGRKANCGTFKLVRETPESLKTLGELGYPINRNLSEIVFDQAIRRNEHTAKLQPRPCK